MAEENEGLIYAIGSRDNGTPLLDFFAAEFDSRNMTLKRIEYMTTVESIRRLRSAVEALLEVMSETERALDTNRDLQHSH